MTTPDFATRSTARVRRAADHFMNAETILKGLASNEAPIHSPAASIDDGQYLCVFMPEGMSQVIQQLELIIADGVHNLRVALDALATELSYLRGSHGRSGIYFPIVKSGGDLQKRAADVRKKIEIPFSNLTKMEQERLKAVQDFSSPPFWFTNVLHIINHLDNQDKHNFGLSIATIPLYSNPPEIAEAPDLPPDIAVKLQGLEWVSLRLANPEVHPPYWLKVTGVQATVGSDFGSGVFQEVWRALADDVWRLIHFIATGTWLPPDDIGVAPGTPLLAGAQHPTARQQQAAQHTLDDVKVRVTMPPDMFKRLIGTPQLDA